MLISVVLCSYNGEDFILEQLDSIKNQTIKVSEVIIQDDQSSDNTVALCKKYIEKNQLNNWNVYVNEKPLRIYNNFISALKKTHGDIIFLSDQDDIWEKNKVEEMIRCYEENDKILTIASTFSKMGRDGRIFENHASHPYFKKNRLKKIAKKEFYNFYNYLGMSMSLKKDVVDMIDTKNTYNQSFDIIINYYAVIYNGFFFLDKPLTRRRSYLDSYSNQGIAEEKREKYAGNSKIQYLDRRKRNFKGFLEILDEKGMERDAYLDKIINQMDNRIKYITEGSVFKYLLNIINLHKYESIKEYLKDGKYLLEAIKDKKRK